MNRNQIYRAYCSRCKEVVRWHEPTGKLVKQILCPRCGYLLDPIKGSPYYLKGELVSEARTFEERKKER